MMLPQGVTMRVRNACYITVASSWMLLRVPLLSCCACPLLAVCVAERRGLRLLYRYCYRNCHHYCYSYIQPPLLRYPV